MKVIMLLGLLWSHAGV